MIEISDQLLYDPELTSCYLDRADELHGKHTVFGRCIGNTVFSK